MASSDSGQDRRGAKEDRRKVQAAGSRLRRVERSRGKGLARINRDIETVRRTKKLSTLALGVSRLYEDRVELGRTRFPLNDPRLTVEVASSGSGDKVKVHLTVSGSEGAQTVSVDGRSEGAARTYAAAIRQAAASYDEVHAIKARTIQRLEAEAARVEGDVVELQAARAALFEEESRTGLTYAPSHWKLKAVGAAAATLVVLTAIGVVTGPQEDATAAASATSVPTASVPATGTTSTSSSAPTTAPPSTSTPAHRPTTPKAAPTTPKAAPHTAKKTPKPKPAKPKAPKIVYDHLTKREWALIARNPDAHVGEPVVIYGVVTQADAATGDTIRADVGGQKVSPDYFGYYTYPTNTIVTSGGVDLGELVEGDVFQARAIVLGSQQYETTLGGYLTVPVIEMEKGWRIGHQPD